jgi:hypothetical protein
MEEKQEDKYILYWERSEIDGCQEMAEEAEDIFICDIILKEALVKQ